MNHRHLWARIGVMRPIGALHNEKAIFLVFSLSSAHSWQSIDNKWKAYELRVFVIPPRLLPIVSNILKQTIIYIEKQITSQW